MAAEEKGDDSAVDPKNIIAVGLDDLTEEDRQELERELKHELEEEKMERTKKKLACFQKTRSGAFKKVRSEVNKPICSDDLASLIDVSVANKFGADLTHMAHTITESLSDKIASFKEQFNKDIENSLPRQVRSVLLQINDEHREKQPMSHDNVNSASLPSSASASAGALPASLLPHDNSAGRNINGVSAGGSTPSVTNFIVPVVSSQSCNTSTPSAGYFNYNFPQPYYETTSYSTPLLAPSSTVGYASTAPQHMPQVVSTSPSLPHHSYVAPTSQNNRAQPNESFKEQLANMLREFGFEPRGRARAYQKPYPEHFDLTPYPRGFRIPDFVKFTGEDSRSTFEHIGQFLAQCSEIGQSDVHKVRLFPLSLSGNAFTWFTSLAPNSVFTWAQLEQKFHEYF